MSNIDKQALRDIAAAAVSTPLWHAVGIFGEVVDPANPEWKPVHDFCKTFTAERVLDLLDELEAKDKRIEKLEGELEVSQHELSDTEDAMHIWADRAKEAEEKSLISSPVAYAPRGHIDRYLNGSNSGCWVYGNPTGEDDDALYMAAPDNAQHFDRNTICETVHSKCSRIPGATFYNAAEFAIDEVERAAAAGKGETS